MIRKFSPCCFFAQVFWADGRSTRRFSFDTHAQALAFVRSACAKKAVQS